MRVYLEAGPGTLPALAPPADAGALRNHVDARCPGAAEEAGPDGSNPWNEGAGAACDPKDAHR
jgi:hypothetical protein